MNGYLVRLAHQHMKLNFLTSDRVEYIVAPATLTADVQTLMQVPRLSIRRKNWYPLTIAQISP